MIPRIHKLQHDSIGRMKTEVGMDGLTGIIIPAVQVCVHVLNAVIDAIIVMSEPERHTA